MPLSKIKAGKIVKTKSHIPKTPKEKKMWVRAEGIIANEKGAKSEKEINYAEVNKVYQNEKRAGKVAKRSDVLKAKKKGKK